VENCTRELVAVFTPVQLRQRTPALVLIVNVGQCVNRLVNPPEFGDGLRKFRGSVPEFAVCA
jgi:hypothetical protein